jgi:hypothetical protein
MRRDPLDPTGASERRRVEWDLDQFDLEIAGLRRLEVERSRETLRRLGFDVSGYTPPALPHRLEQRSRHHAAEEAAEILRWQKARGANPRPSRNLRRRDTGDVIGIT